MARRAGWLLALGCLLWLVAPAWAQVPVPALTGRVVDRAGVLARSDVESITDLLRGFEQQTGGQIAVLLVRTTQGEPVENFSLRVAEAWKLGRKGQDKGALLVVALDDRRMRIEVGYGLEGVLPDAKAKRIIAEVIAPQFKLGQYGQGIREGIAAMGRTVKGGEVTPTRQRSAQRHLGGPEKLTSEGILLLAAILFPVLIAFFAIAWWAYKLQQSSLSSPGYTSGSWDSGFSGVSLGDGGGDSFSGSGGDFGGGGASGDW